MTDRELLELAAEAAGYRVHGVIGDRFYVVDQGDPAERFDPFAWNPLKDDGDALRLAVRLGFLDLPHFHHHLGAATLLGNDVYAATRRAIVLTAAEYIGEQK